MPRVAPVTSATRPSMRPHPARSRSSACRCSRLIPSTAASPLRRGAAIAGRGARSYSITTRPARGSRAGTDAEESRRPTPSLRASPPTILWLRRDLRLGDNPALLAAARKARDRGGDLLPVFVWEPPGRRTWAPGGAARWWLLRSLESLDADLRRLGSRLLVERGDPVDVVAALAADLGAGAVVWAEGLEPDETADDAALRAALNSRGVEAIVAPQANLLAAPLSVRTREGHPYTVFTPYWRARLAAGAPDEPPAAPAVLPPAPADPPGLALAELEAEAVRPWSSGFAEVWQPGERGAHARLDEFLERTARRLCRRPRPARPRRQLEALAAPALGRADRAPGVARGPRRARGGGPRP